MKAVVWHGVGVISLDDVPDPTVKESTDAVVRLTTSAICGTDLHMIRGTLPGMVEGTILGHEGVGVVEEVGGDVRGFRPGDRVVVPATICCGACPQCRAGHTSQCDRANPNGPLAGTVMWGGPKGSGPVDGMQAGYVRVPFAGATLVPLPDSIVDEQAIICSDVLPTAWFGASIAGVSRGDTVAVFGAGPVGLAVVASAWKQGASRVLVVDEVADRLEKARSLHAEPVNFSTEDPVAVLRELTGGVGPDRVVDAVGVDAYPRPGDADDESGQQQASGGGELAWHHGTAPSQAMTWAVDAVAKCGTVGIIGVYPPGLDTFPLGAAMNKNLVVRMGNAHHRPLIPALLDMVAAGTLDPAGILTREEPVTDAVAAYRLFDQHAPGWVKIALHGLT